jgi:hypothetical protein
MMAILAPDESDSTSVVSLGAVRPIGLPRTCSDEALADAVKAWLIGNPPEAVAEILGVKKSTLPYWTQSEEWQRLAGLLMPVVEGQARGGITRTISVVLEKLEDVVTNGNPLVSNEGEIVGRVPVKAKDLAGIAKTLYDIKEASSGSALGGNIKLHDLMKNLERFANAKEIPSE